ncbi:protocatechuate 3,4-dioxygenase subunit alpha [Streptomyces reniochalinae]|uniref:Protocatechuate 3,4-dioxygenase subunit alpha n=1 Tax=Streptomyces reniochalinae TaxID=2250578 RepID=A0A367EBT9_9ACTN|nr:protocatechuate 3,4-dioxygenase subunit alpha [Streptomyces reniochalinae]RCG15443.1 protocatechuate 3,4-dioxygenase subunit alpha [Streptomyces reniochalinae]
MTEPTRAAPAPAAMPLGPTPSQTVGPFYGYALPFAGGGDLVPAGHPEALTLHGYVFDGAGEPVPDALLEFWQADPAGSATGAPGSLRRDPVTGEAAGRDGVRFTGFARIPTDADGHWMIRTLAPGPHRPAAVPYLALLVFARGLLHHLYTRVHLPEHAEALAADPAFAALPPERLGTLLAVREAERRYRFDLRLQGEKETVFLDFPLEPHQPVAAPVPGAR